MKFVLEKLAGIKILPYLCNRNQEQVQDFKRNDGTFRTSRLTTSIKVQISRESQRDRTLQTSKENATELVATLKATRQRSLKHSSRKM